MDFFLGVALTAMLALTTILGANTNVPYADIHEGVVLCAKNGGLDSLSMDRLGEHLFTCRDTTTYHFSADEWAKHEN